MSAKESQNESENDKRWLILRAKIYEEKLKSAFGFFRQNGVEPILIKGWSAAREYPEPYRRVFTDIDFCVSPDQYEKSQILISSDEERKKLNIDLHNGLRHLDTLEWADLFDNSQVVYLDDVEIRILRPEDHLRVLSVHWLTDGGAYKEKLLDLYYLLKNREKDFEWDRCFGKISSTRRLWIIKTIGIVRKYFALETDQMPFETELKEIPEWLIDTLEKEWASDTRLMPIQTVLNNRKEFWKQLKKRIPPNSIQATIDMEGEFDDSNRFFYQVGSIYLRLKPSLKRVYNALKINKLSKDK